MARVVSKNEAGGEEFPLPSTYEQVTYVPGPQDPPFVRWRGHVFHANIPKRVTNEALIEQAKGNRFFRVGPFDLKVNGVTVEETPLPKTSQQYRAWAVAWFKTMTSERDFDDRWAAEETLRMDCEVGTDDIDYLWTLAAPKKAELHKMGMAG